MCFIRFETVQLINVCKKVPIAMFTGVEDEVCPREQALEYAKIIGDSVVEIYKFEGKMHGFWAYASDEDFM